ncbi:MAG: hypothetical protein CME69_12175 [Halobacteriovorax sp.]|nr:hypothetical protein [Halobacteriovorax sp.]
MVVSISGKEFSKNNTNYVYDLYLVEKLVKHLMHGGKNYKVQKYVHRAFKNLKLILRVHPVIVYFYILFFFLVTVEFQKVRKAGQVYKIPQSIMDEDIFLLRTVKLFSNVLKAKWDWESDLQSKLFSELFFSLFFLKRTKLYNNGLKKYYNETEEGIKHIGTRFRW